MNIRPILFLLLCTLRLYGQDSSSFYRQPDSVINIETDRTAPLWRPAGEVLITQLIPFTFNYFSTDPNISKISFQTIGHNLNLKNWEFDDDKFLTNQFAHPYHGNLYYNAFRSTGHSFWQSAPGAIAGSLVWELAGETNPPSYNDMVNTSLGGIVLGEMTYRMAGLIINKKRRGKRRLLQELLATAVDPVNGFNRLIDRKWGAYSASDPEDSLQVDLTLDAGVRLVSKTANELFRSNRAELYGSARLRYGNPFRDFRSPFDNFYILMEIGDADSARLNSLWVQGSLWGKITGSGEKSRKMLRLTMNYDFYKNTAFEYGGQSLLFTWMGNFMPGKDWTINAELGGGAVLLSASRDKHRVYREARDYTYGSGLAIFTAGSVSYKDRITYLVNFRSSWTATISGSSSSKALHLVTSELKLNVFRHFSISASWGNFELLGFYPGYESSDDVFPFLRCSAGYRIVF